MDVSCDPLISHQEYTLKGIIIILDCGSMGTLAVFSGLLLLLLLFCKHAPVILRNPKDILNPAIILCGELTRISETGRGSLLSFS